jgi:hypothetical protein
MQKGAAWDGFYRGLFFLMAVMCTTAAEARVLTAPMGTPTCYANALSDTMIEVKWTDIEGETQYRLERLGPTGWVEIKAFGGGGGSSIYGPVLDTNVEPQKTYTYRVRGWNSAGFSEYSNQAAATTWANPEGTPTAPMGYTYYTASHTSLTIAWFPVNGAAGYRFESRTGETGTWVEIGDVPASTNRFTHTNLTASTTYFYRMRAYNAAGLSAYSEVWQGTTHKPPPPTPVLEGSAKSYNELELRWNRVIECDCPNVSDNGYDLEIRSGADWTNLVHVYGYETNYVVKALQPATEYSFRIRAENPLASEWSYVTVKTQDAPPVVPLAPVLYAEKESGRSIRVKWLDVELETEYRIEKRNAAGQWVEIATVPANTLYYIDSGLEPLTTYTYRVRAANSYGASPYSNESAGTTGAPPEIPRITARAWGPGKIQVLWYQAEGAVLYRLERDSGAGWQNIYESTTVPVYPDYVDSGLTDLNFYKYRVGAKNAAGTWFYSAEVGARPHISEMEQAEGVSAKAISSTAIELTWDPVPFSGMHYIVRFANGSWQVHTQIWNVTKYVDTSLLPGTTYSYLVYGTWQAGAETPTVATATTLPSDNPGITVSSISLDADNLTLRLIGRSGETFRIQRSSDFSSWSNVTDELILSGDMEISVPQQSGAEKMFYRTMSAP